VRRVSPPSPHLGVREEEGELVEKVVEEEKTRNEGGVDRQPPLPLYF